MSVKLEDLGWPEAKLFDLTFDGEVLCFKMLDLLSYGDPLKFEIVEVVISKIEALRIEMTPNKNGIFFKKEIVVDIGVINEDDEGFEGGIGENALTETQSEKFWVSADVSAKNIEIYRTGQYEYLPRAR